MSLGDLGTGSPLPNHLEALEEVEHPAHGEGKDLICLACSISISSCLKQ